MLEEWQGETHYRWVEKQGHQFSAHETAYIVLWGDKHYGSIVEHEYETWDEEYHYYYIFHFERGGELDLSSCIDGSYPVTEWGYCVFETPKS